MNWIDAVIAVIVGLSVLIGLWRGLISEVLALVIWAAAIWVAWTFGETVSAQLVHSVPQPVVRTALGYGICFIAVLIVGAIVRFFVSKLVTSTGFGGTDRLLGMIYGFARGVLVVTLAVFLLGLTAFANEPMWKQSMLLPQFTAMAAWLHGQLPDHVRHVIDHPPALPGSSLPALQQALSGALPATTHASRAAPASSAATTANH